MKIIVHVGAHKTGSTLIQEELKTNIDFLGENGIFYKFKQVSPLSSMLKNNVSFSDPVVVGKCNKLCEELKKLEKTKKYKFVIISSESFLGQPYALYDNAEIKAMELRKILNGFDVEIVVFVRRQDTFIESLYSQKMKEGGIETFEEFTKSINYGPKWYELLIGYEKYFRLHVFPYEDLLINPNKFFANLMKVTGTYFIEKKEFRILNNGFTKNELRRMREDNSIKPRRLSARKKIKKSPSDSFGLFSEREKFRILSHLKDSNIKLFKKYMPQYPLDTYFYKGEQNGYDK